MKTRTLAVGLLGSFLALLPAAAGAQKGDEPTVALTFGVYQTDKATVMYRAFTPVLEAIQARLETILGRPADIELRIYKRYAQGLEGLVRSEVDFVRFGPASYVLARAKNPRIELLAMEQRKGKKTFKGLIVVRKESPIRTLADLAGRRFAFGNANSTIGRYLAQAELVEAGIHARDLARWDFLGRHDKVVKAVQLGDYDAGAVKAKTFKKMNRRGELRVLESFDNVTKPWIASARMKKPLREALRSALVGLEDPRALKALKVDGFLPATDADYDRIRQAMKTAERFHEVD